MYCSARLGAHEIKLSCAPRRAPFNPILYCIPQVIPPYIIVDTGVQCPASEMHPGVVEWWLRDVTPQEKGRVGLLLCGTPPCQASSLMRQLSCTPSVVLISPSVANMDTVRSDWSKDMKDRVVFTPDVVSECADACGQGLPLWTVTEVVDTPAVREEGSNAVLSERMGELLQDPLAPSSSSRSAPHLPGTPAAKGKKRAADRSPSPVRPKGQKRKKETKKKSKPDSDGEESDESSEEEKERPKKSPAGRSARASGLKQSDTSAGKSLAARLAAKDATPRKAR